MEVDELHLYSLMFASESVEIKDLQVCHWLNWQHLASL